MSMFMYMMIWNAHNDIYEAAKDNQSLIEKKTRILTVIGRRSNNNGSLFHAFIPATT